MRKIFDLNVGDRFEFANEIWYVFKKTKNRITIQAESNRSNIKYFQVGQDINVKTI